MILKKNWFVYMVRCQDGCFYTGATNNVERRVLSHNQGRGARFTRARRPVKLLWSEKTPNRSAALKREAQIKSWTRREKEKFLSLI